MASTTQRINELTDILVRVFTKPIRDLYEKYSETAYDYRVNAWKINGDTIGDPLFELIKTTDFVLPEWIDLIDFRTLLDEFSEGGTTFVLLCDQLDKESESFENLWKKVADGEYLAEQDYDRDETGRWSPDVGGTNIDTMTLEDKSYEWAMDYFFPEYKDVVLKLIPLDLKNIAAGIVKLYEMP